MFGHLHLMISPPHSPKSPGDYAQNEEDRGRHNSQSSTRKESSEPPTRDTTLQNSVTVVVLYTIGNGASHFEIVTPPSLGRCTIIITGPPVGRFDPRLKRVPPPTQPIVRAGLFDRPPAIFAKMPFSPDNEHDTCGSLAVYQFVPADVLISIDSSSAKTS